MAIDRNAYKSLTESVMEAVNPIPQEAIAEDVDVLDEILAEGIEIYGEEGMVAILEDFADTGEISEELAYLLSEDIQTPGRDEETWRRMRATADRKAAADLALRASRNAYLTKQGIDPDAESSSLMDWEKKDKAIRKHDRSPEGRKLMSHQKAIGKSFQGLQTQRKREREDTKNIYAKGGKKIRLKDLDKGS